MDALRDASSAAAAWSRAAAEAAVALVAQQLPARVSSISPGLLVPRGCDARLLLLTCVICVYISLILHA